MIPKREEHKFMPKKLIKLPEDIPLFLNGNSSKQFIYFLEQLQESIRGKNISFTKPYPKFDIFKNYFNQLRE
jgi:hypothetical protein